MSFKIKRYMIGMRRDSYWDGSLKKYSIVSKVTLCGAAEVHLDSSLHETPRQLNFASNGETSNYELVNVTNYLKSLVCVPLHKNKSVCTIQNHSKSYVLILWSSTEQDFWLKKPLYLRFHQLSWFGLVILFFSILLFFVFFGL